MTAEVEASVNVVFDHQRRLRRSLGDRRRPGLPEDVVVERFGSLGLTPPSDIVSLYATADGVNSNAGDILDEIHFFPGYYWPSLDKAIEAYRALSADSRWGRAWFPVFASGGGDFYAVVSDPEAVNYGGVVGFILDEPDHLVEYESITAMLRVIAEAFARDVFFVENGYLEADDAAFVSLGVELQPKFEARPA